RASQPLELIHLDICGPMQTITLGGNRYFLTFIDDHTRMCWVFFLQHKSQAFNIFKRFKNMVELQRGYQLKKLRSDRGGEYTSLEFSKFCEEMGLERQLTIAYSPQQNGVAERKNRTVMEMARTMMHEKKIPFEILGRSCQYSCYTCKIEVQQVLWINTTPFEKFIGTTFQIPKLALSQWDQLGLFDYHQASSYVTSPLDENASHLEYPSHIHITLMDRVSKRTILFTMPNSAAIETNHR
ncbi:zinc ion-binding protein, partial [Prunus dulcis]